ncbi:DUF4279 domain-containing protein [Metabacillus idriensis]|nr:DUF4279 domain-containing protein [Metabacillus idriensis]MCM3599052.1 DUF4279 domain-containing protein [Metabacillus idriensis]
MDQTEVMAYFSLFGETFPTDEVTEMLGIEPTEVYNKGEFIVRSPNPNVVTKGRIYRKETSWSFGTVYEKSFDIKYQLDQILKPLENKVEIINRLKKAYNLTAQITIVIKMEDGATPGLHLDRDQIEFANQVGAEFDIDLYANPYKGNFED